MKYRISAWSMAVASVCTGLAGLAGGPALAQDTPAPANKKITYSPYPAKTFPNRVYFGDTHLHTSYSTDAGMIGNTLGPEEAYRFARGEEVKSSTGQPVKLGRPLDFLVVADHSENLGLAPALLEGNPELLKHPWGKMMSELIKKGDIASATKAYDEWLGFLNKRVDPLKEQTALPAEMWKRVTAAAEKYNEPGRFTAFIGFEWTAMPDGANMHRNVIYRDGKAKADQVVTISQFDTDDAEKLWEWMAAYEKKTGGKLLAIPHGGNLSNGLMFDDVTFAAKKPIDRDFATRRMRWEPLYEVTQIKGDAETHPLLSTRDEFAKFERWDRGSFGPVPKTPDMLPREYARESYKRGLAYEAKLGVNPFKFGMVGSTDAHNSIASTEESNFFGKVVVLEPSADPIRFDEVIGGRPGPDKAKMYARETSASGLAAVWSRENTREALWDAMARKEVYATTGTRMQVRVFGGFDFNANDLERSDFAEAGYARGVPMGGDLKAAPAGKVPSFLIRALRDADGANLDRVQVVKGWLDTAGKTQEKVYDVAWAGVRKPGKDGKLPAVGNTVNVKEASYTNAIGAPYLTAHWKDAAFDARQRAFYYVRVLEIPTPRWTTFDAKIFGVKLPTDVPASIQERAYTTPIWYTPS